MTFYYIITAVGVLAAIINFTLGWAHRQKVLQAAVRLAAGVVSLVPPVGFVVVKLILNQHLPSFINGPRTPQFVFIAAGMFIGGTLMLPAYIERGSGEDEAPTIQERAARPVNATVRLQQTLDEWVN
ncbi:MAG TPA: hypothetical protein VGR57_22180 [Ktedonobacterales bacterium]|nr:hypothetical protein [Ktedonobacterales bacterium]